MSPAVVASSVAVHGDTGHMWRRLMAPWVVFSGKADNQGSFYPRGRIV